MKKILLSSLLCSSVLFSSEISVDYEIIPTYGYSDELKANRDETYNNIGIAVARNLNDSFLNQVELAYFRSEDISFKNSNLETNVNRFFFNGIKDLPLDEKFAFYGLAGLGFQNFTQKLNEANDEFFMNYGLGLKYKLDHGLTLRADARHMITRQEEHSLFFTFGIAMPLGGYNKQMPVETPVVIKKEEPKKEPVIVKKEEPKDTDKDGIFDTNDKCPNTFLGAKVNSNGCEFDNDSDGIVDKLDQCPNTMSGIEVGANGCELDSDNDGVVNSLDKCPYSPADAQVDKNGCVEKLELKINFDSNKADIRDEDRAEIEALADFLKKKTQQQVIIEAHTDSRGSAAYNLNLSKKRANAAKQALVDLGINSTRIEAIGYGETQPTATNTTAEGREENRRITVIFK